MAPRALHRFCGSHGFRRLIAIAPVVGVAAVAASFAFAGGSGPASGRGSALTFRLDHFQCYRVDPTSSDKPHGVVLRDQFGPRKGVAFPLVTLCNPVRKNGSLIRNARAHLACYTLKSTLAFAQRQVAVTNQFEQGTKLVVARPVRLCVPSGKSLDPALTPAHAKGLDHFECYLVKPLTAFAPRSVKLLDEFKPGTTARVVRQSLLCNPVSKNRGVVLNPRDHLVCYQLVANSQFKPRRVSISNQFTGAGKATLVAFKTDTLCVPSLKRRLG